MTGRYIFLQMVQCPDISSLMLRRLPVTKSDDLEIRTMFVQSNLLFEGPLTADRNRRSPNNNSRWSLLFSHNCTQSRSAWITDSYVTIHTKKQIVLKSLVFIVLRNLQHIF